MPRENRRAVWLKLVGFAVAREAVEFCKKFSNRVLDPLCGQGTTLHAAEELGMDCMGVGIDPKVC
jgi:DNA modification methylase